MAARLVRFVAGSNALVYLILFLAVRHWYGITPAITAAFIGAAFMGCFFAWDTQYRKATAKATASSGERVFVRDNAAVLDLYGKTEMSSFQAMNDYLDKWIKVAGRFEGSAESLQRDAIHVSLKLDNGRSLPLRFAIDAKDNIAALRIGQRVVAISQIRSVPNYGNGYFALANSEFAMKEPRSQVA